MSTPLFLLTDHGRVSANAIVLVADWPLPGRDYLVLYTWGGVPCETFSTAKDLWAFMQALKRDRQAVRS